MKKAIPDEGTAAIIEEINNKIEMEQTEQKRNCYKAFFKTNIYNPLLLSYEEKKILLDALDKLHILDISMLQFLTKKTSPIPIQKIQRGKASTYELLGCINRLKYYGFVATYTLGMAIGAGIDNSLNESVTITNYGKSFLKYVD